jgi:serine/threonine protein kinase
VQQATQVCVLQVLRGKSYNAKVDIFSFGVVVYQIFGRQNISSRFESEEAVLDFAKSVARGHRLAMPKRFSKPLAELIDEMWADDPRVRPTAAKALVALKGLQAAMSTGRAGGVGGVLGGIFPGACLCMGPAVVAQ